MNGHQNEAFSCLIGALNSPRKVNGYGADYALTAPNWYLNNVNKAVTLNGSNALQMDITAVTSMYKLKVDEDGLLQVIGMPVVSKDTPITIHNGWNWLGAATTAALSPAVAFSGLEPVSGDVVKSQREFSIYSNGQWVGSLETVVPGVGYLYNSRATEDKTFTYPTATTQGRQNAPRRTSVSSVC